MEAEVFWTLVAVIVLLIVYLYYKFAYASYQSLKQCGITGPSPTPIFGNFLDARKLGLLEFEKRIVKQYGPVSGYFSGQLAFILITDPKIIKKVMVKNFDSFPSRRPWMKSIKYRFPKGLLFAEGKRWKLRRVLVSPTFSSSKLKMMIPIIARSVKTLLKVTGEAADTGKSVDTLKVFTSFTLETIMATAFGRAVNVQRGEADTISEAVASIFGKFKGNILLEHLLFSNLPWLDGVLAYLLKPSHAYSLLHSTALEIVKIRRNEEQRNYKDLLQLLLDATLDEKDIDLANFNDGSSKLSDEEVVMVCEDFILAGYETTGNTLAFISYLLALNPEVQEELQREIQDYYHENPTASTYEAITDIKYLDMVVYEALRLYPVAARIGRKCDKDIIINGLRISKGFLVIIPNHALLEDPQFWPEPHKFDPLRFTDEEKAKRPQFCYIPFGAGPRSCVGMRFAMIEIKMVLLELMKEVSFVRCSDTEVPLQLTIGLTLGPTSDQIKVCISRRL